MRFGKSAIYLEHLQTWYLFVQYPQYTASRRNVCKPTQHAFMHYIFVHIWSLAWHNFVQYLNWMSPRRVGEDLQNYLIRHYDLSNEIHIASALEEYLQRASHTFILTNTILTNQTKKNREIPSFHKQSLPTLLTDQNQPPYIPWFLKPKHSEQQDPGIENNRTSKPVLIELTTT